MARPGEHLLGIPRIRVIECPFPFIGYELSPVHQSGPS